MNEELSAYRLWAILGWLMLAGVVTLSLVRIEQPLHMSHADKYQHLLAYASMMYWWGMVQPSRRLGWLIALPILGLSLEGIQGLTSYRGLEWGDALANVVGVLAARILLSTPAGRLLAGIDHKLFDRAESRRP